MKILSSFFTLVVLTMPPAFSSVDEAVLIRGEVGNVFDDNQIKVKDSFGQSYFLPRRLFPSDFNFKQGQKFALEVEEKELDGLKIKTQKN